MPRAKAHGTLIDVAVMAAIRRPLTYRAPDSLPIRPGQRVLVPLASRKVTGIALGPAGRLAPGIEVREILRALDPEPLLSKELLELGQWISSYYLAPIGEVFRAMLPLRPETGRVHHAQLTEAGRRRLAELTAGLLEESRRGPEAGVLNFLSSHPGTALESLRRKFGAALEDAQAERLLAVAEVERPRGRRPVFEVKLAGPLPERPTRLSPVARRIIETLERQGAAGDHRELLDSAGANLAHLRKLTAAGLIELREAPPGVCGAPDQASSIPILTPAQASVLERLTQQLEGAQFGVTLLHGITGSGKTEIYLRLIEECLKRGHTALMMVPEIGLTPSVQSLVLARFGRGVAVLHSGLSESVRDAEWWRIRRGDAQVVLGTRSAVFAPLANLGVVVVDEEHDSSYKQEETPRYHGRDVAVVRGRLAGALVLLGSATPSLESYHNAREGKYRLLTLPERVGGRLLASVEVVDMRQEFRATHSQVPISRRLHEELESQLRARAQTMILLNRRGYAWYLLCRSCGEAQRCVNCSISLTYHRREHRLICHYCGYTAAVPSRCPACGSEHLYYVGEGTEKVEAKFGEMFPQAHVARLDRDVARRPEQFSRLLADFRQGKIDVLVGTQLIAKGHDFPGVTLVGVVSADTGLGLPDFRAAERTFQLLTQAAGRAGRGEAPGRVLVQTFYPDHYVIRLASEQNYEGFFVKEMSFRRAMHYPPVRALANIVAQDARLEKAAEVARSVGDFFGKVEKEFTGLKILGPGPAPLARIEGLYRIQFLIKSLSRSRLNALLHRLLDYCERHGIAPRSLMIDVDPVSVR